MTCKDCIHYEVCTDVLCYECNSNCCDECGIYAYNDGIIVELSVCEHFKDKSKYIELPCKVGDVVYIIEPFNGICDMTLQNTRVNDLLKNNIFLTKSEAEQKLKELNANG